MTNSTLSSGVGKEEWAQATDKARQAVAAVGSMASHAAAAVGEMASQAGSTVEAMAGQAACDAGKQVDNLTASAGIGIQRLGNEIDWNGPQKGALADASHAVAKTVRDSGEYLEDAKLSGIAKDLTHLIQKNPIPAVCLAIGLGWFIARSLRN
jgi:hypothetical protein